EVTGHKPKQEPEAFEKYCPVRNVDSGYPPTLLLHGDQDTDVPIEQSKMMAEELDRNHVAHELLIIPNRGHGFDEDSKDPKSSDPTVRDAFSRVTSFFQKYL